MKIKMADAGKNLIFLFIIAVILTASFLFVMIKMKTESRETYKASEKVLKILIVMEESGEPISTNVIAYYPETKRAAMFDIPGNTGLIIKSLNRTDGIGVVYKEKGIEQFKTEIEKLSGISVPFFLSFSVEEFSKLTDMLGGLSVFIPAPVDIKTEQACVLLPSGSVMLDGDKIKDFITYEDELDNEGDSANRRQKAILALLRAINDNSPAIFSKEKVSVLKENIHSNLSGDDFYDLLSSLSKLDSERLVPQRVTGAVRFIEEKKLLMPFRDGRQFKDVVKQAIAVLASGDSSALERIYAIEILNGTDRRGLAGNTSEIYQSFGYDVVQVANSDKPVSKTILIDRIGNSGVAEIVANVIRCDNIKTTTLPEGSDYGSERNVDFTLILGSDFNGYFVIK